MTNLNAFFVVLAFGYLIHRSSGADSAVFSYSGERNNLNTSSTTLVSPRVFSIRRGDTPRDRESRVSSLSPGANAIKSPGTADITFISQLKGQFHDNPILGLSLALCLFSMAGIPPLVGFFAKYSVLYSAIENGYYFLALVGILASVISAAYYLRIIRVIHFDSGSRSVVFRNSDPNALREIDTSNKKTDFGTVVSAPHSYTIAVLTLFILLFLLSPSLVLNSSNLLALSLFTA